jgi:hypothetical protein
VAIKNLAAGSNLSDFLKDMTNVTPKIDTAIAEPQLDASLSSAEDSSLSQQDTAQPLHHNLRRLLG